MSRLTSWVSSWATTLHIMFNFERETYRALTEHDYLDADDFGEAERP